MPTIAAPTITADDTRPVDTELVARAQELRERAQRLRTRAQSVNEVLATTFRRRAAELELEAWASEVRSGQPLDAIAPVAA